MHDDVHDVLASYPTATTVRRELHDIPPHHVYEITFDGERAVCKLGVGPEATPVFEGRLLEWVGAATTVPVPRVLAIGDDHVLLSWADDLQADPVVTRDRLWVLGATLARLHDETAPSVDAPATLRSDGTELVVADRDSWSAVLLDWLEGRRRVLDRVGFGALADEAISFVANHQDLFDGAEDVTLVHGNYLPSHVGVDGDATLEADERVTSVVDFEHALFGPGEFDYVRSAMPMFGPDRSHDVPERTFKEAYESVRTLPTGFEERRPAYEALNLVSYVRSLHVQRADRDDPETVARRARSLATSARDMLATCQTSS